MGPRPRSISGSAWRLDRCQGLRLLLLVQVSAFVGILPSPSPPKFFPPQVDRATELKPRTQGRKVGGVGNQDEGSKCRLTCLQQLLSISSMKPGQRPWHQVSALGDRYPTAQEGGGNIRGHSHSHLPRLEKALNNMLPGRSCSSLGPGQATTVVTADLASSV